MNAEWKAVLWGVAVLLFVVGSVRDDIAGRPVTLHSLGLAFFALPFFWDAAVAADF